MPKSTVKEVVERQLRYAWLMPQTAATFAEWLDLPEKSVRRALNALVDEGIARRITLPYGRETHYLLALHEIENNRFGGVNYVRE